MGNTLCNEPSERDHEA
jgi:pimeloyl-ACP methyl ester carboxylesterase